MNTHQEFSDFNSRVRLAPSKRGKLKSHRKSLRQRIRDHFAKEGWPKPLFASQGSFPLQTNVNPIRTYDDSGDPIEEYDLDDGVYFICPLEERETAKTYHDRLLAAVDGHTNKSAEGRTSCVRVIYHDGHHVDLPVYWSEGETDVPQIGRPGQGYSVSDPKAFKEWVNGRIEVTDHVGQLRRVIRYLKAWKNYRETNVEGLELPPGVTLTILACRHFVENDRDDVSFRETVRAIANSLKVSFTCYRPTTPTHEDLLESFNREAVLTELDRIVSHADEAESSDSKREACEQWREVFGDRFPKGEDSSQKALAAPYVQTTTANKPWGNG